MIYLGADHRGYKLKEKLREYLTSRGYQLRDMGTDSAEPVDYPMIAERVARGVAADLNNRGILLCGSGAGVCIVANKFNKIRAAQAWNEDVAHAIRHDDNANVLCLPADSLSQEEVKQIVQAFLDTSFGGEARYQRRIKEIEEIEKNN
ncbi:MAG: RpiB/LacA/LacB family sugar-phosphate isomerase [Candidatus Doudnabacteria bacterium]|nr:RpiB/LacA/LacB family sugar-phosphate isomerase [Candidatus Doudnabacteria bacterium]